MKTTLTADRLRHLLNYDQETGVFTWLNPYFKSKAGKRADHPSAEGYRVVSIDGYPYLAHRLAWLFVTGQWPSKKIDHWDCDRENNAFKNLRDVRSLTNSQNMRRPHNDSVTGHLGVSRHGKNGFQARIQVDGRTQFLGTHPTAEAAHAAYVSAKRALHEGCTL